MRAEEVRDELLDMAQTITRLHDANILSVDIGNFELDGIHLRITGDPTPVICDIGLGLIDRDEDWHENWVKCSMTDINGIMVYWLEQKETPDAATSEASGGKMETADTGSITRIGPDVKEDSSEGENEA